MKFLLATSGFFVIIVSVSFGQIAQGPAAGSIPGGAIVNTNNFGAFAAPFPAPAEEAHKHPIVPPSSKTPNMPPATGPEGSNYFEDPSLQDGLLFPPPPITVASFQGNTQFSGFPPDPDIAVGPNHIIQVVNTSFRISDKSGNTLKTINATSWFQSVLPGSGAFDPRVFYDHHANRWFMVWDNFNDANLTAYFLVSVSDDDDPIGVWFNWALPANVYGSTPSGTWQDHETAGFDRYAYYITGRHFGFPPGGYFGNAVRILPKQQFLGSSPDTIRWHDFWALRDLNGIDVDQVRPSFVYSDPTEYYLAGPPNVSSGTYFVVYRITNPLGTPAISCAHVPVTAWSSAPNAGQLGGGQAIEAGSSRLRHPPIYRDSSLWMAHSVYNGGYSAVRYLRINTITNTAAEDAALGALGFWHFYPALTVDKDNNIAITFSRSGDTQYAGAYYTWRLNSDPPGLRPSETIRPGAGNYVVLGNGRNRWGDYMGASLDPADKNILWFLTEYASGINSFSVWAQGVRLVPWPGRRIYTSSTSLDFGRREALITSDTLPVTLSSIGAEQLTITSIANSTGTFTLLGVPSLPITLSPFDTIGLRVVFQPTAHGVVGDSISIGSNDSLNTTTKVYLTGKGVIIGQAHSGVIYATSAQPASRLFTLDSATGTATAVGPTEVTEIQGLAIRPVSNELYGTYTTTTSVTIYRLSTGFGDALPVRTIPVPNMRAIAFNAGDTLYGATTTGKLYRINLTSGDTTFIGSAASVVYSSISFNPLNQQLWASVRPTLIGRDNIYKVNTTTGTATLVGATGFNVITPHIAFDALGKLFGLTRPVSSINDFIRIDTSTAVGTVIGSTGVSGLLGLAMRTDSTIVSAEEFPGTHVPSSFALQQNYPNPFNPVTRIGYALPVQSKVRLSIFNLLGQEIAQLVDGEQHAGRHEALWNGTNSLGINVPSGLYFYSLEAHGDGTAFRQIRKMLLLK